MHEFRVTKYDPARRSEDDRYLDQNDWTEVGDVGSKVSADAYLATEARYIRAALRFLEASAMPHLRVTCLVNSFTEGALQDLRREQPELYAPELERALSFHEDQCVRAPEIALLMALNFRGVLACRLELADAFYIHIGWDFYAYVGCAADCTAAVSDTEQDGLFVEPRQSPYRRRGHTGKITILVSGKPGGDGDGIPVVEREIVIASGDWKELRRLFGFSDEHTFFGTFGISPSVAARLSTTLGFDFDIARYDYAIDTTAG